MRDQPYTITISTDGMAAWLCFTTNASVPLAQLHEAIATAGIVHGIKVIQKLIMAKEDTPLTLIKQFIHLAVSSARQEWSSGPGG